MYEPQIPNKSKVEKQCCKTPRKQPLCNVALALLKRSCDVAATLPCNIAATPTKLNIVMLQQRFLQQSCNHQETLLQC